MLINRSRRALRRAVALPAVLLAAAPAFAQGIPRIEHEFPSGAKLRFYGQINKGILDYDDGVESDTYYLIDNDNSSTRFGLRYDQAFGAWTFTNVNEFKYAPYSTGNINIIDDTPSSDDYDWSNDNIRKIDFSLANETYGTFYIGQGSMATDGAAEVDLSGTDVIGYSGVADSASAQIIRYADQNLLFDDNPQIGDAFANYDGGRLARIRYDTPSFGGFSVAFAFGRDLLSDDQDERDINQYDVALLYGDEFEIFDVEAAVGYYSNDDDASYWAGSVSAIHTPTGINGTFAAGRQDEGDNTGSYWYGKLGLLRNLVDWGASAAAIDYYSGSDVFVSGDVLLFDAGGEPVVDENGDQVSGDISSSDSTTWGLSFVQNVDPWNTELWLTFRNYDYSDNFAKYEDGRAIFGGARFRF